MSRKDNMFKSVPIAPVNRNLFDLSHEVKMSAKFGYLYPVLLMDTLPGDTIRDQMTAMVRMAPMLAPVMHRIDVTTHFFFVPFRLIYGEQLWENFITGGQDGTEAPVLPYVTPDALTTAGKIDNMSVGSLWDYLGLPAYQEGDSGSIEQVSIMGHRAYAKVFNDYYRDPTADEELELDLETEGNVSAASAASGILDLQRRGWMKDYFTAALPFAQRGAEVLMPLAGSGTPNYRTGGAFIAPAGGGTFDAVEPIRTDATGTFFTGPVGGNPRFVNIDNIVDIDIDASSVSINDLRRALAIQRWLENNARGGPRYIEQIESHFNTRVPDYRLQRAEYLGGGKQPIQISEVLATANTNVTGEIPVGDMAGHGISVGKSNRFTYRCQEHGLVIGIMSIMPTTAYSQGIDRMFSRKSKFDFAWPELAHLGEQEILSKELLYSFAAGSDGPNQTLFGYIPRYSEYKFKNDRIAGDFRTTLAFWHLGRLFTARPALDSAFLKMIEDGEEEFGEESYRRIFAVEDGTDYLWIQLFHRLTAKRPLPYFGVPRII